MTPAAATAAPAPRTTGHRRNLKTAASSAATSPSSATWLPIATRVWTPGRLRVASQDSR